MSISNQRLSFNLGNIQKQDVRNRPSKYAMSDLRNWRYEQSEGIRPAEVMQVYRYLPVAFQDVNTEDWVVIPKGRIVSAIGHFDTLPYSGLPAPQGSGYITIGNNGDYMGTGTGAQIDVSIDNSFFGYDEHICNLLVPANGGSGTVNMYYSSDDVTAGTKTYAGTAAAASGAFALPANIPIGVAYTDMYQDIRGKYLNYRAHPDGYQILTDWYVEVPFVDYKSGGDAASFALPTNNTVNSFGQWRELNKQFTYLSFKSDNDIVRPGALVCPDILGNYKIQGIPVMTSTVTGNSGTVATSGTYSAFTNFYTAQTVGKVIALDSRFPKDSLEDVLTYPRSGMPGSQTAGIIKNLFDFVYYTLLIANGTAPTVEQIYNGIRSGVFGLARIQLLVS